MKVARNRNVPVPGREINPKLHTVPFAGFGDFFHDITFPVFIRTVFYGMCRVLTWPEAESVMMFGSEYYTFESCFFQHPDPLIGIHV